MDRPTSSRARRSAYLACLISLTVLTGLAATACTGSRPADQPGAPASHATMAPMTSAAAAAWAARPEYTHASPATKQAYRYALEHPLVLKWIPCYCGCGAIDHGSNLDCYFEPNGGGGPVFEEHASYCTICVDITLRAIQLADSGSPLSAIRAAIDAEFGGAGPGTDTPRPAS